LERIYNKRAFKKKKNIGKHKNAAVVRKCALQRYVDRNKRQEKKFNRARVIFADMRLSANDLPRVRYFFVFCLNGNLTAIFEF
jgi:hypothetical protein